MLFFELLQVAIGNRRKLSQTPSAEEWRELYAMAQMQTLVGIAFRGIEQLPQEQRPPKPLLMQWYMAAERIKAMNADLDRKALAVANKFLSEGFPSMVLKGQGISKLYELRDNDNDNSQPSTLNPQLSSNRTPGDIDIWLQGSREEILGYVRQHVPDCKPVYHHVDFPVVDGLDIEVHFTPSWMNSPVTNRRLQRFFRESAGALFMKNDNINADDNYLPDGNSKHYTLHTKQVNSHADCADLHRIRTRYASAGLSDEGLLKAASSTPLREINLPSVATDAHTPRRRHRFRYSELPVPNLAFNRVYILVHIYRHLFHEGIGLRQLLDYYFVLAQGFTEEERIETMRTLRSLRMQRFTAAVMWVLQQVYGMDSRYLLTTPDEREGRFLLNEIMLAGNFGHYDERLQHERGESALHWGLRKVKRNFRFVFSYPSEVLWSPLFKLWHWCWRSRHTHA